MPSVSVLYIEDQIVGPHLELLRNVCEPNSRSRPHVTVRYFDKLAVPKDHLDTYVDHIDLLEIGSFGLDSDTAQKNKTVFIRCQSEALLLLEHKPHFPTSQFHITLYDGTSETFARELALLLAKFRWRYRVPLPPNASLKTIELKAKSRRRPTSLTDRVYPPAISNLFRQLVGEEISYEGLQSLPEKSRLTLARKICKSLSVKLKGFEEITVTQAREPRLYSESKFETDFQMHLTPPELAKEIATYALSLLNPDQQRHIDFGDPAVGTGAFFAALLSATTADSIRSAIGVDISPRHVEAARWRWANRAMEVIEGDYLHMEKLPQRNLILANPPYLRHQSIPPEYKQELRQRASATIGMRISGLSGQYIYFLLLSHKWLDDNAVSAWLIPSEFMQTDYGRALRFYLTRMVELIRVHQFSAEIRQFENAETLPCVVVFRNRKPTNETTAIFSTGGSLNRPSISNVIDVSSLEPDAKWSLEPRPVRRRDETHVKLGDLFNVRRGIATGANEFFVLDRDEARALGIPDHALRPILPKAKNLRSDVIETDEDGFPRVERQLCVIDSEMSEAEIRSDYPRMMEYLNKGRGQGVLERHLVARRKIWYKQEHRDPSIFLCTYMGKAHGDKPALRFFLNKSQAIATNTYLLLYPNESIAKLMQSNPEVIDYLFRLLKDSSWDAMMEFSRTHAGGLTKIEPRDLLEVWLGPIPAWLRAAVPLKLFSA